MATGFIIDPEVMEYFGHKAISTNTTAIMELVKNSRDANATKIEIEFIGVGKKNGMIKIEDNGDGMNLNDIMNKWMVVGTKSRRVDKKTRSGKAVWGEMGIGRFACSKLGKHLKMITVKKNQKQQIDMAFDWTKFKNTKEKSAEDVMFGDPIVTKPNPTPQHGVTLEIYELNSKWTASDINDLIDDVGVMLADESDGNLSVIINKVDATKSFAKLRDHVLDNAPYKLRAKFDGENLTVDIFNFWGSKKWEPQDVHGYYEKSKTGPFEFEVWNFPRGQGKKPDTYQERYYAGRIGTERLEKFIKKNYNVMLYRDGIWFKPYGNAYDWLGLDTDRVQSSKKLGTKNFYGILRVTKEKNPEIKQTSNRESIMRNEAFEELEKITREILDILAKKIYEWTKEEKIKDAKAAGGSGDLEEDRSKMLANLKNLIRTIPKTKDKQYAIKILDKVTKNVKEELNQKEESIVDKEILDEGVNNVAMIGIAASHMSREVGTSLTNNMETVREAEGIMNSVDRAKPIPDEVWERSEEMVESLAMNQQKMKYFMQFVGKLGRHVADAHGKNYKPFQVRIWDCVDTVQDGLEQYTKNMDITIERFVTTGPSDLKVKINRIDIECILTMLCLNSIESLKRVKENRKKKITIEIGHSNHNLFINVTDNGIGIPERKRSKIFDPFEFGHDVKNDDAHGHGLGLYFVKEVISQNYPDGKIDASYPAHGVKMQIVLPNVKRVAS